jgi:hypothetical protein
VLLFSGIACLAMGVQAYFFPSAGKEPSMASLMAAGGCGLILIACTFVSIKNPRLGYIPALVICLLLIGRFVASGFNKGFDFYPGIVTILIGVICGGSLLAGHLMAQKAKKDAAEA